MNHLTENNLQSKLTLKNIRPRPKRGGDADWLAVCEISLTQRGKDKSWLQRQQILPPLPSVPTIYTHKKNL